MTPRRIGFVLVEGFAMMSTAAAMDPLRAANLFAERTLYDIVPLSRQGGPVAASLPFTIPTTALTRARGPFDLIFVVAGGAPLALQDQTLFAWLRQMDRQGVPLGGISGGAAILAQAGLMENRRFTVHWHHLDELRALSPDFLLERRLFVIDRDRYSCAGGSAPLDMMQAILARDHGTPFARRIADWFIQTEIRPADAPQQASLSARYGAQPRPVLEALELMETHQADPLDLAQIASLVGLSARQLQRQFRDALGLSVIRAYREMRLATARDLLHGSRLPVGEVAAMTGFSSPALFSDSYRALYGETPRASRRAAEAPAR